MLSKSASFRSIRKAIDEIPVIDCHDHSMGYRSAPEYKEPIASLIREYVESDLMSVGAEPHMEMLKDQTLSTEQKWPVFQKLWKATEHTSYARVTKLIMEKFYGESGMSLEALMRIGQRLLKLRDEKVYEKILDDAGIVCRLVNIWIDLKKYLEGKYRMPGRDRMLVPLPDFHHINSYEAIQKIADILGKKVTSLDEYVGLCGEVFSRMKKRGTIGMKDQSAYNRPIKFSNATREEAERVFNKIIENPRFSVGFPELTPLSDYLFHQFMRMARKLDFFVQIHTGHMAGIRNEISKTNAVLFTSVLEMHSEVRFDIFHGNWPYDGEVLYLAKNYSNVHIDACWLNVIDAYYARKLFANSIMAVPHTKIHGFGADYTGAPEYAASHLLIAKDAIAAGLAEVVDMGWLKKKEAIKIAVDWLFNNPNEWYKLGFDPIEI
ncbi:hypothetical protein CEE34_02275 [Candidatus Aerophobetes bacterium Ae_b3a]|nr:MAG: hypothetical protein CEE34_02275 [Candidatus Aerophobetes bacterium Ae_b3a]